MHEHAPACATVHMLCSSHSCARLSLCAPAPPLSGCRNTARGMQYAFLLPDCCPHACHMFCLQIKEGDWHSLTLTTLPEAGAKGYNLYLDGTLTAVLRTEADSSSLGPAGVQATGGGPLKMDGSQINLCIGADLLPESRFQGGVSCINGFELTSLISTRFVHASKHCCCAVQYLRSCSKRCLCSWVTQLSTQHPAQE